MGKGGKILKVASIITVITLVSKLFGFVRELIIAYYFGTSGPVDMYVMAVNIPTIILGFLTCVGTAYTPVFTEISIKKGKKKAIGFTNILILSVLMLCAVLIFTGIIISEKIVSIMAPGFSGEMLSATAGFLKISLWNIPVTAVLNIFLCYLQCNERFIAASLCMLAHSSIQIIFALIAGKESIVFLVWGFLIANILYCLFALLISLKHKYSWKVIYYEKTYAIDLGKLILPIFVSSMLAQINGYVDKYFASSLEEGSISALGYANTVRTFLIMMLNTGLTTVLYPTLSKYMVKNDVEKTRNIVWSAIRYSIIVFIPVTAGIIVVSDKVITLLFARGNFDKKSVEMVACALIMYGVGITAVGIRDIMVNFFYSIKNSRFTLYVSAFNILINIVFNLIMVRYLGMAGLALGTSVSAIVSLPFYFKKLNKCLGPAEKKDMNLKFVLKVITAAVFMMAAVYGIGCFRIYNVILKLGVQVTAGIIIYFSLCYLFKIDEVRDIMSRCGNILKGAFHGKGKKI